MVELGAKENCKVDEGKIWPQIIAIMIAGLTSMSSGIFFTWPSPTIPILLSEYSMDELSYLTIIPALSVIITSPISGRIIDLIGRKYSMLFIAFPQLISWCLVAYGGSIYIYYIARAFCGLADSCSFSAVPSYVSEVSTPKVRGTWGNFLTFAIYFGNFIMNVVGAYLPVRQTACAFAFLPIIFIILCLTVLPETPYYLLMKGRNEEAKKSLQWLRGRKDVENELKQLTSDVTRQLSEPGKYKDLFTISTNRRAIFIGAIIRGAQQFSGISAIAMYTQYIFHNSGSDLSASTSAIVMAGFLVIANFISSFVLAKFGRRLPMIVSCLGSFITLAAEAIFFYLNDYTDLDLQSFSVFPLAMMVFYILFYSIGLGIVPTIMLGELFSSSIKGKALCIMNVFFGAYISSSSKIFTVLIDWFGLFAPFAFFAICCFLSTISSYYFVPETKGKTLEEIQQGLTRKKNKDIEVTRY